MEKAMEKEPGSALQTGTYYSNALGREQPYAYLLPPGAQANTGADGARYPLLVMLHGHSGKYTDWPTYTRIARYVRAYSLIVAFPDGGNGWYTNAYDGSERREDDLIQDFVPHLQNNLPLAPPGKAWGLGGLSMGGYGAVKLALKHPKLFSVGVSHSGVLKNLQTIPPHPVYGAAEADGAFRRGENVYSLIEAALCEWPTLRPRLHLDCGLDDELLEPTRQFHGHLTFRGYPHTYNEMPGQHTWPYWDRAFKTILPIIARDLGAASTEEASHAEIATKTENRTGAIGQDVGEGNERRAGI